MDYVSETSYFDYNSAIIQDLLEPYLHDGSSQQEKAKKLYLMVRDGWRYNPYRISFDPNSYKASQIAQTAEGHCIDKAILFITCLRGLGIPARLRLGKVTNHIAVERLTERIGTNILTPHGMAEVFLKDKWIKATPAFNAALCLLCNVEPLEFDGEHDSVFQEYNADGKAFMEYLEDYGHFEDVPIDFIKHNLNEHYPGVFDTNSTVDYHL